MVATVTVVLPRDAFVAVTFASLLVGVVVFHEAVVVVTL